MKTAVGPIMGLIHVVIFTLLFGDVHSIAKQTPAPLKNRKSDDEPYTKEEAEETFLRREHASSISAYVEREWLSLWRESYLPETKFTKRSLIWWNEAHNFVAPKKQIWNPYLEEPQIGRIGVTPQGYKPPSTQKPRRRRRRRRRCTKRMEKRGKCTRAPGKRSLLDAWELFMAPASRERRQTCTLIPTPPNLVRREWRQMSQAERDSFIAAFNAMASTTVPGGTISEHDLLVEQHRTSNAPSSQDGAGFLPWHREWLWRFSNIMRSHGYTSGIPFWDNIVDAELPNPADSAVWTSAQFGTSSGLVTLPWTSVNAISACELQSSNSLRRDMKTGASATALMLSRTIVDDILDMPCFQDLTKGWNGTLEESHERILMLMGTSTTAQMSDPNCAPTDPVYWLHTTFMDHLWERYRTSQQSFESREIDYPLSQLVGPGSTVNPNKHRWKAQMRPFFGMLNAHGMSNHYTSYYYTFSIAPYQITCSSNSDCTGASGSMLWCHQNVCRGQIRQGGQCNTAWPADQCYCPTGTPSCDGSTLLCQC